jgi:hypothetical protein
MFVRMYFNMLLYKSRVKRLNKISLKIKQYMRSKSAMDLYRIKYLSEKMNVLAMKIKKMVPRV